MRSGGGKNKGSAYERKVCEKLSLWITHGKAKDCLWRSAMSGGRATVHHAKGSKVRQVGDVVAVSPEGHALDAFFFECKHYKSLDIEAFLLTGKGRLAKFWSIITREAKKHERKPVLIARQNRTPDLVLTMPGEWTQLFGESVPGMTINVRRKGIRCELRLFDELIAAPYTPR